MPSRARVPRPAAARPSRCSRASPRHRGARRAGRPRSKGSCGRRRRFSSVRPAELGEERRGAVHRVMLDRRVRDVRARRDAARGAAPTSARWSPSVPPETNTTSPSRACTKRATCASALDHGARAALAVRARRIRRERAQGSVHRVRDFRTDGRAGVVVEVDHRVSRDETAAPPWGAPRPEDSQVGRIARVTTGEISEHVDGLARSAPPGESGASSMTLRHIRIASR